MTSYLFSYLSSASKTLPILACLGLAACASRKVAPQATTMTVCDDNGCVERPKNYASRDPASTRPPEDLAKIDALEELAANDSRAAYDLALRFFRGDGVRQDSYRSLKWMRDAAERGELNAQKALGRLYLTGMGEMGADPGEAEKWLSITAGRGDREAKQLLQEATAARQEEQDHYFYERWHPIFLNSWSSSYAYFWQWRGGQWALQNETPYSTRGPFSAY